MHAVASALSAFLGERGQTVEAAQAALRPLAAILSNVEQRATKKPESSLVTVRCFSLG